MCVSGCSFKICSFFGKFGVLCFHVTPVLRSTLWPYYQWSIKNSVKTFVFFKNNWNLLMQIQLWYIWFSSFNKISVSALFFWNWNEKRKKLRYMKLYCIAFLQSIHTFCGSKRVLRHWLNISETSHNDKMFWPPSYLFLGKRELDIFLKS